MEGDFVLHRREVPNIQEEVAKLVELSDVGRGWTLNGTVGNVNCYTQRSDRSPFNYILGEGIIHTTADNLLNFLREGATADIDPALMDREEIVKLSDTSRVVRLRFRFPALFSNREVVLHAYDNVIADTPRTIVSMGISVEHEMCQEDPNYVRGLVFTSGYVGKQLTTDPPRTHLSYVVQFDPKGWLPAWVMNLVATDQALNVLRLKQIFEKPTEQTYKFSPQVARSIATSHNSEGGDAHLESTATTAGATEHSEWQEQDLSDGIHARKSSFSTIFGGDEEAREILLDTPAPVPTTTTSKILQFFS